MPAGGKRKNAGRKPLPDSVRRVSLSIRLHPELAGKLPKRGKGRLIEAALVLYFATRPKPEFDDGVD